MVLQRDKILFWFVYLISLAKHIVFINTPVIRRAWEKDHQVFLLGSWEKVMIT